MMITMAMAAAAALAQTGPADVRRDPPRPGMERPEGRGPMGGRPDPARMFDRIDANHDGVVSRAEFMAAHQRMEQRREMRREGRGGWGADRPQGRPPQR